MALQLTAKERMLLEDQKEHEELCIQKYQNYSMQASDPELRQLFASLEQKEQEHLNSINQILAGQIPDLQQSQSPGQQMPPAQQDAMQGAMSNQKDSALCTDMLSTEKYVSGTYDTTIFECTDTNLRQVLNHIQKEEQEHGEQIYNYMHSKGMYNPQ